MEETETVRIAPVQQRAYKEYLRWLRDVQPKGVTREALFDYYADDFEDHVYKIKAGGDTYAFTVFTKPGWLGLDGSLDEFVGRTKAAEKVNHRPKRIKRLARELYIRQHDPTDEVVTFPMKKLLWNGDSLCISSYDPGTASFEIEYSDFYSYCSTGESMLREFYDGLWEEDINRMQDSYEEAFGRMNQRTQMASEFADFLNWGDHFHKIGPVCVLVLKRPDGHHEVYYTKRSHYVLQAPDFYSVTPAGELQTRDAAEVSMQQKAVEELSEEVLGVPDEMSGGGITTTGGLRDVVTTRLNTEVAEDAIQIRRTAFGFDMYAVKPIFTGLVYVSDPETSQWCRERLKTNWETEKLKRIVLPRQSLPNDMHPNVVCSSGALAFYEGMRTLEQEFEIETGLDFSLDPTLR